MTCHVSRVLFVAFTLALPAGARAASFRVIPDFTGGDGWVAARLMNDGRTIKGVSTNREIFRWTSEEGYRVIDTLPGSFLGRQVLLNVSMSADGSTVFGSTSGTIFEPPIGFFWQEEAGLAQLIPAPGQVLPNMTPTASSPDGKVIVGTYSWNPASYPLTFIWRADSRARDAGLPGYPNAVSNDGSTIVGSNTITPFYVTSSQSEAYRWTEETGAENLGVVPESTLHNSSANYVSADGSFIVGDGFPPDARTGSKSIGWTAQTGMRSLGTLGDDNRVLGMSADGSVVIGSARSLVDEAPGFVTIEQPFVWTEARGMQFLNDALESLGVNQDTWFGDRNATHGVSGASLNGRYVFGGSVRSSGPYFDLLEIAAGRQSIIGNRQWIVDLAPIPEPSTLWPLLVGVAATLVSRRTIKGSRNRFASSERKGWR
jgi:uncharacterized membrane protein